MEDFQGQSTSGYGQLPRELLQRIYTQPVLEAQDRLRALAVCKWWGSSLAGLPFASMTLSDVRTPEYKFKQQLLWVIRTQPAIVDLKLESRRKLFELVSKALQCVNKQALHSLRCWVTSGLCLPCPAIFPGLESLSLGSQPVGPEWVCHLPRLNHLTHLSLCVNAKEPEDGSQGRVFSFPAVPSLRHLVLSQYMPCSVVAPWADMPSLRKLELGGGYGSSVDLSTGGTLPQLEALHVGMDNGRAAVDFALLPALNSARLMCKQLEGAATVQQAALLTQLYFAPRDCHTSQDQAWLVELCQNAPPSLRRLEVGGKWTAQLTAAVAGLQQLRRLVVMTEETALELPAGPLWEQLQVLCWGTSSPLPLALRGAPQLHTLAICLRRLEDLHLLLFLPALKHLRILEGNSSAQDEERRRWQESACFELVRQVLPHLESLKAVDWNSFHELASSVLPG